MERTLVELLRSMQTPGLRHVVVTLRSAGSLAPRLPSCVPCVALDVRGSARLSGLRVAHALRPLRPHLIHARNPGCWADALFARILRRRAQLVLGFHGLESGDSFSRRDRFVAKTAQWFGAEFTTVSRSAAEQLMREAGVPAERITVLRNGVDLSRFAGLASETRANVRAELGLSEEAVVVGTVGALSPVKRQDLLLDAFARCHGSDERLRLLLVGEGPCRAPLEAHARSLRRDGHVVFAGWREDVPRLLAAMDIFVTCSDSEGMSNALLEAMAAGLPVIATRVGSNEQVLRDGTDGWVVPRRDANALARAIHSVAADVELRRALGRSARLRADQFSFTETVRVYERFYRDRVFAEIGGVVAAAAARNTGLRAVEGPKTILRPVALKDQITQSEKPTGALVRQANARTQEDPSRAVSHRRGLLERTVRRVASPLGGSQLNPADRNPKSS